MATAAQADRNALARAYLGAWNAHDAAAVSAFFGEHAVYDDRGAGMVARGRPAIHAHIESVLHAFPDVRFELVRTVHGEDFSLAQWTARMTHLGELDGLRATGRMIETAGVDVATLDSSGSVIHLVSYYDGADIMRGLGVLPGRNSRAERLLTQAASLVGRLPGRSR